MSKGSIFVLAYSIVLLVLFVVFCVLMTSVNPDRLLNTKKTPVQGTEELRRANNFYDFENDNNDKELRYGLEKVSIKKPIASILRKFNDDAYYDDKQDAHPTKPLKFVNETTAAHFLTVSPSMRGQRRSITEQNVYKVNEHVTGAVMVKIIDDIGYPRIEIKLKPKGLLKHITLETNVSSKYENYHPYNSTYEHENITIERKDTYNLRDDANTVINIMPNNTLYFDKIDNSSMDDVITKIETDKHQDVTTSTFEPRETNTVNELNVLINTMTNPA